VLEIIFNGSFMPHGHCLLWRWDLLFLHVAGDALTEFFKVVVRFSRFMLLPELARFPAQDSDLLAL
jgi:hypothetical protein